MSLILFLDFLQNLEIDPFPDERQSIWDIITNVSTTKINLKPAEYTKNNGLFDFTSLIANINKHIIFYVKIQGNLRLLLIQKSICGLIQILFLLI